MMSQLEQLIFLISAVSVEMHKNKVHVHEMMVTPVDH